VLNGHSRSGSGSEPNCWQMGSLDCQFTQTVNSDTFQLKYPNLGRLGRLAAGRPEGPSEDSYNAVVFAV